MTLQEIFYLRLNCSGCRAEAWVNGIDVSRVDPIVCPLDGRPVHEYILPAKNHLALLINPDPYPSTPMKPGDPFTATARTFATLHLLQGPRGALPDDPEIRTLAQIEWRPPVDSQVQPPLVLETEVELPVWLPRWSWLDATPISASGDLNRQVFSVVRLLAESMRKGDTAPYIRAAETRFAEVAQAYGLSADETKANFAAQWAKLSAKPGFEIALPAMDSMALRVVAGNRVIDCIESDFEPMLRAKKIEENGTTPIRYPIRLAVFGRELRIIR